MLPAWDIDICFQLKIALQGYLLDKINMVQGYYLGWMIYWDSILQNEKHYQLEQAQKYMILIYPYK